MLVRRCFHAVFTLFSRCFHAVFDLCSAIFHSSEPQSEVTRQLLRDSANADHAEQEIVIITTYGRITRFYSLYANADHAARTDRNSSRYRGTMLAGPLRASLGALIMLMNALITLIHAITRLIPAIITLYYSPNTTVIIA